MRMAILQRIIVWNDNDSWFRPQCHDILGLISMAFGEYIEDGDA